MVEHGDNATPTLPQGAAAERQRHLTKPDVSPPFISLLLTLGSFFSYIGYIACPCESH